MYGDNAHNVHEVQEQDSNSVNGLGAGRCLRAGMSRFSPSRHLHTSICHHQILVSGLEFFRSKISKVIHVFSHTVFS